MKVNAYNMVLLGVLTMSTSAEAQIKESNRVSSSQIRVYNDFDLPLEPSTLYSMSEYNLSLCLFEYLFTLDDGSAPQTHILDSWKYDSEKKAYIFKIKANIQWSDGQSFSADDIIVSLTRLSKVAPGHYLSISSLLKKDEGNNQISFKHSSLVVTDDKTLTLYVDKPEPDLFKRLTGVFIPLVRRDLLDSKTWRVKNHHVTLGPYTLDESSSTREQIVLKQNPFHRDSGPTMANSIVMRRYPETPIKAEYLAKNDFWPNLVLDRVFVSKDGWETIKKIKAMTWTRPVDRIAYMYPTRAGQKREDLRPVVQWLGSQLQNNPISFEAYPGVLAARSMQPRGFFLYKDVKFKGGSKPVQGRRFKVAFGNNQFPSEFFQKELAKLGFDFDYKVFPIAKLGEAQASQEFDFIIGAFGAADPDPVTWLTLVLENEGTDFIADYDGKYRKKFSEIKKEKEESKRYAELKELMYKAGEEGLYLPLAHFSSLAVGDHTLDLTQIRASDETVNLSKVKTVNAGNGK